uniref:Uncharacterized protein n=1 Tax=viral metagenome TaxID=1070528 RepID=A0A6C0JJD3_9ZZZZ
MGRQGPPSAEERAAQRAAVDKAAADKAAAEKAAAEKSAAAKAAAAVAAPPAPTQPLDDPIIKWIPIKYEEGCSAKKEVIIPEKEEIKPESIPNLIIPDVPKKSYLVDGLIKDILTYLKNNGEKVDQTISETNTLMSACRHTDECRNGRELTNDDKKIVGLQNYTKLISDYNTQFEGYNKSRKSIIADTMTCRDNLSVRTNYFTTILPEFYKNNYVIPLNKEITDFTKKIAKVEEELNFVYSQLENFKINENDKAFTEYNKTMSDYVEKVKKMNSDFKSKNDNNKKLLYTGIGTENIIMTNKINESETNAVSDIRASQFIYDKTQGYYSINWYLFVIYYIALLYAIFLVFTVNTSVNIYVKITMAIVLGLYPFLLEYVQPYIFYVFDILVSFATVQVYKDPNYKYSTSKENE